MKRKTIFALLLVFALSSTAAFAQDNEAIDKIIQKNPLVAKYVQELQNAITGLTEKNSTLEETVKTQQEKIAQLNQTINDQTQTINTQQTTISDLTSKNDELNSEIQYINLGIGIYEGSSFGTLKDYLKNKEVFFSNENGKEWRGTTDENGYVQIKLPAGKYNISIPGYKSSAYKFIPEKLNYGFVYTDSYSASFANNTSTGIWFYDENNLPPLP